MEKYYIERMVMRAISYRIPRRITHLRRYWISGTFAVCPRCNSAIERDYMRHCTCCGQRLSWRRIRDAIIDIVPLYRSGMV